MYVFLYILLLAYFYFISRYISYVIYFLVQNKYTLNGLSSKYLLCFIFCFYYLFPSQNEDAQLCSSDRLG